MKTHHHRTLPLLAALSALSAAQTCYYPNGNPSQEPDAPCGGSGNCCPLNWQCLSNGLCLLPTTGYLQRTTCTDRSWGATCPQICLYDKTAIGNEAILQCSDGRYCCDKNRTSGNCCEQSDSIFFDLANGTVVASITAVNSNAPLSSATSVPPNPTTVSSGGGSSTGSGAGVTSTSSTPSRTSTTTSSAPVTTSPRTSTSLRTSLSTSANGGVSTVVITMISTPTASSSSGSSTPVGTIVGAVVGVVGGLLLLGALAALFLFHRRRVAREKAGKRFAGGAASDGFADMYAGSGQQRVDEKVGPTSPQEADGAALQMPGRVPGRQELQDTSPNLPEYSVAGPNPQELHGRNVVLHELPGDAPTKGPLDA